MSIKIMLNRDQYELLYSLCDKTLKEKKSTDTTIAISWLHINRWHPVLLKNHNYLFDKTKKYKVHVTNAYLLLIFVIKSIYRITKSFRNTSVSSISNIPNQAVDILFISHLINKSEIGKSNDSYYGDLPKLLSENGITSAVVKINHTKLNFDIKEQNWGLDNNIPRFILPKLLSLKYEIRIFLDQIKEFRSLVNCSLKKSGFSRNFLFSSSVHALSPSTSDNIRFSLQIKLLLENIKPKCVIVTYEGFAWERLAFSISRKTNQKVKCIGYQQSAIFESQHSAYRDLSPIYNSDYVFTSGEITKSQIELMNSSINFQIKTLGSKQAQIFSKKEAIRDYKKSCIVAPESFRSETKILFDFSILCAKKNPNIKFIWRLHPKTSFENLMLDHPNYKNLPTNIVLSDETLKYDLLRSSFILYRGSTTVIPAISLGLIPIYYKRKNELSIDPIYDLKEGKLTISTEPDFEQIRTEFFNKDALFKLFNYGAKYYKPYNINVIKEILEV